MSQVRDPEAIAREAEAQRLRRAKLPAVLDYAFRPMFLAAGSWAVIALALWLAMFFGYVQLPTRFDPLAWHVHEMLFGFVMAAVAGFLLTAIPNWTGRLPVRGYPLAALACLWLLGRIACLISADIPAWLAVLADLAFPVALLAVAAREIITGRNWRNLPMTAPLALFIVADLLMHLESLGFSIPVGLGWRLAVGAPILLISVIGGRIIPSFTRNWLFKRKSPRLPSPHNMVDTAAVGVLGVALLGLSIFNIGVPVASAIHALTAGATAVMILAVMPTWMSQRSDALRTMNVGSMFANGFLGPFNNRRAVIVMRPVRPGYAHVHGLSLEQAEDGLVNGIDEDGD